VSDKNLIPSSIITLNDIIKTLQKRGLEYGDIILLIQRRTRPKISLKDIRMVIDAVNELEKNLKNNIAKRWNK